MAAPPSPGDRGAEIEATDARQARPTRWPTTVLAVSTVGALLLVAVVWAFWAGPLNHATSRPQASASQAAEHFHTPSASPAVKPSPAATGAAQSGEINAQ